MLFYEFIKSIKSRYRFLFPILCYCVFFVFLIYILKNNKESIKLIDFNNLKLFVFIIMISLILAIIRGIVNQISFYPMVNTITNVIGLKLAVINTVGNYFPFSLGLLSKGHLLKKRFNISYNDFFLITINTFVVSISIGGLIGLTLITLKSYYNYFLIVGFGLMFSSILFIFIKFKRIPLINKFAKDNPYEFKNVLLSISFVYIIFYLMSGAKLLLALKIIGLNITFAKSLLLVCGSMLTRIISLTPANIGLLECVVGGIAYLIGIDFQLTVVALGIERIADVLVNFTILMMYDLNDKYKALKKVR